MEEPTPLRFITVGDIATDFIALVLDTSDRESLVSMTLRHVTEEARQ